MDSNINQLISLNGKNTLITGAFGGIGKEVMSLFLAHDQHVTAITRRATAEISENLSICHLDLNDEIEVTKFAKDVEPFDNVVLCHGVTGIRPIPMLTPEFTKETMQTNFFSKSHLISQLLKYKKILSPGRIVNVSSISAHYGSKSVAIYSSSHSATETFLRSLARSCLKKEITVNSVAVNAIWTPLFEGVSPDNPFFDTPLGPGDPVDVANAVYFSCQSGSRFITGETFFLTGGQFVFND